MILASDWLLDYEFGLAHVQLKPKLAISSGNLIYLKDLEMIENVLQGYGNFSKVFSNVR